MSEAIAYSSILTTNRAISKSLEALNTASKLPSGLLGDMISTSKKEEIQGAYREAADAVTKALEAYLPLESARIREEMDEAKNRDDTRMDEINGRIGKASLYPWLQSTCSNSNRRGNPFLRKRSKFQSKLAPRLAHHMNIPWTPRSVRSFGKKARRATSASPASSIERNG